MQVEQRVADIAARQHGLITRAQLLEVGMPLDTLRSRVKCRRLLPVHRGVYRVGPLVAARAREMAAVLACGAGSVVSHRSAARMWRIWHSADHADDAVDVMMLANIDRGRRPGVRPHRVRTLPADEITQLDGIPVTTLVRTIIDVASEAGSADLTQLLALATREHNLDSDSLLETMKRYADRPGVPLLRALLQSDPAPALTRSQAERQLLSLMHRAQLPRPAVNAFIDRYEVDFLWRRERLIVEVDGFAFHAARTRFENDRRRDATLTAQGFLVMRVTWRQITAEPEATLVRIAQALTSRVNAWHE
jgi:very-short-patch-repair endonuclease/predicted transcriptional regulator of viral defense system